MLEEVFPETKKLLFDKKTANLICDKGI